jgi:hypothetical protein
MNYGALKLAAQGRVQDTSPAMLVQIANYVNVVVRQIQSRGISLPALEGNGTIVTVAGTSAYGLPSDYEKMVDIRQKASPAKLIALDAEQFDNIKPDPSVDPQGQPLYYYLWGVTAGIRQVTLYPTPDAVYTLYVRYLKLITDMSSDTDTPVIPDRWQWLITQGAYAMANEWNTEDATALSYQQYETWLERYAQDVERENEDYQPIWKMRDMSARPLAAEGNSNPLDQ